MAKSLYEGLFGVRYILNKRTDEIHEKDCKYLSTINPYNKDNIRIKDLKEYFIQHPYMDWCSYCMKDFDNR